MVPAFVSMGSKCSKMHLLWTVFKKSLILLCALFVLFVASSSEVQATNFTTTCTAAGTTKANSRVHKAAPTDKATIANAPLGARLTFTSLYGGNGNGTVNYNRNSGAARFSPASFSHQVRNNGVGRTDTATITTAGNLVVIIRLTSQVGANGNQRWSVSCNLAPTIVISNSGQDLRAGEKIIFTITTTEPTADFVLADLQVEGGTLGSFVRLTSSTYTVVFTPLLESTVSGKITAPSGILKDSQGILNADGADANNSRSFNINTITNLALFSGGVQSQQIAKDFAPLSARVTNSDGDPVVGHTVTFTANGLTANASLSAASAVTNASGVATVTATANSVLGNYSVTASGGSATPVNFTLTNIVGDAAKLEITDGTPQSQGASSVSTTRSFAVPLGVKVTDAGDNPVPGHTVIFTANGATASATLSTPLVTGANGETSVIASTNDTAGLYSVTASSASLTAGDSVDFTLTNLLNEISVSFKQAGSEAAPAGTLTVTRAFPSDVATTINLVQSGTATSPDFSLALPTTATIPANAQFVDVPFTIFNDNIAEGIETVTVTLGSLVAGSATVGANGAATSNIVDDDSAGITVSAISGPTTEASAGTATFTVVLNSEPTDDVVIALSSSNTVEGTVGPASLTFTAANWNGAQTVTVTGVDDNVVDGNISYNIGITPSSTDTVYAAVVVADVAVTNTDDDSATISISNTTNATEGGPSGVMTVSLSSLVTTSTTVAYVVEAASTADGTDYSALTGTVTIPANISSVVILIAANDDIVAEGNETVTIRLTGVTSGQATLSGTLTATNTIVDNDTSSVSISNTNEATEAGTVGVMTVLLSSVSSTPTTVTYTVVAASTADGADYTTLSGTITIASGDTTGTISIVAIDDTISEGDETVVVKLDAGPFGLVTTSATDTATNTITDNESLPTVSIASTTVGTEDNADGIMTVSMAGVSSMDTVVSYSVAGTATSGTDYVALSGTVTIPAGDSAAFINITVLNDGLVEPSETVIVTLTGVTAGSATITSPNTATNTITDNDLRPTVAISNGPSTVAGGETFQVIVTFSEDVIGFDVTDIDLINGTAVSVSGGPSIYVVSITSSGGGDVTVSISENAAQNSIGNWNEASNSTTVADTTGLETQKIIAEFMQTRANLLLSSQPKLRRLLTDKGGSSFNASIQTTRSDFNLSSTSKTGNTWMELTGNWSTNGGSKSEYVFGALGGHRDINPNLLVGAMFQFDYLRTKKGVASTQGTGWLAGPYVVGKFPNQPLYFEGRLLYGQSNNKITPFGTYTDKFQTERWLAQVALSGEIELEKVTLWPLVDVAYTVDKQRAFTDSLGNNISSQSVALGQLTLGMDFSIPVEVGRGELEIIGGISGIWSHTAGSGTSTQVVTPFDGTRGRIDLGANYTTHNGARFRTSGFYDGIGQSGFEAYGLTLAYEMKF